jgi:hypothetical protein
MKDDEVMLFEGKYLVNDCSEIFDIDEVFNIFEYQSLNLYDILMFGKIKTKYLDG